MIRIIILAAGKGSRMESTLPKVMHKIADKTMLSMVVENASKISSDITIVYSKELEPYLNDYKQYDLVIQKEQLGTGNAVLSALRENDDSYIVILYGDNPFISDSLIRDLLNHLNNENASIATLAFRKGAPQGYGRIMTDENGAFLKIIECRDANIEQKKINLCNSGIMAFAPMISEKIIPQISNNNAKNEYYLTDAISIASDLGLKVTFLIAPNSDEVIGVNTKEELLEAKKIYNS